MVDPITISCNYNEIEKEDNIVQGLQMVHTGCGLGKRKGENGSEIKEQRTKSKE